MLGVERSVDAGRAEARLSQAGDGAAPRPQPGRQGGGGAVQGGVGGVPGALRSREARALRPLRPRRPGAGFGGGFHDVGDIFSAFSDIFGDIFGGGAGGGRRGPARGADIEMRVSHDAARRRHRRHARRSRSCARAPCAHLRRQRRRAGTHARDLPALRRARPGDALAGLPDDLDHLPGLPRRGAGRAQAVRRAATGPASITRRRRCRSRSRPASRTARRCAWSAGARRRRAAGGPATSTSSCASRPTSASSATAPTCTPRSR